ncbi:predicted protein [Sclerotinia sclerotiorum 1980 UF-70]|uniref:Uncharacterized protein n=1 Tax=Sclerotinia sclerotiorum (strain ATCC 18683 / 1980 / Ss-1) TaxID=665079 RepID=A7E7T4_SCLS1|nr:predicted protein [Sclerotinia sclerotiorum 1980 UF-70]EDN96436.1 predicted protein [Sclerotinia sclerotiorum 1980 UF-70]
MVLERTLVRALAYPYCFEGASIESDPPPFCAFLDYPFSGTYHPFFMPWNSERVLPHCTAASLPLSFDLPSSLVAKRSEKTHNTAFLLGCTEIIRNLRFMDILLAGLLAISVAVFGSRAFPFHIPSITVQPMHSSSTYSYAVNT